MSAASDPAPGDELLADANMVFDRRATFDAPRIDPRWRALSIGERIPDYGGRDEYLEVARIDPGRVLVYRSGRKGARFIWATCELMLRGLRERLPHRGPSPRS